jgi:hypothetical protein
VRARHTAFVSKAKMRRVKVRCGSRHLQPQLPQYSTQAADCSSADRKGYATRLIKARGGILARNATT